MRVSCLFVTVAIMLAGENQSLPLDRRQGIPLISTVGSTTKGIQGKPILGSLGSALPVTKGLTSTLGSKDGAAPVGKYASGATTNVPVSGPSSEPSSATHALPSKAGYVNGALPDAASGVKVFPVTGPTSSPKALPATQATTQVSPLSGTQPKVNTAAAGVSKALPASGLPATASPATQAVPSVTHAVPSVTQSAPSKVGSTIGALPDTKNAASAVPKALPVSGPTSKLPSVNQGPTYQTSPLSGAQTKISGTSKVTPASGLPATVPSVTQVVPSKVDSVNGAQPDTKNAASVVTKVLPVSGPTSKVPSVTQDTTYQVAPIGDATRDTTHQVASSSTSYAQPKVNKKGAHKATPESSLIDLNLNVKKSGKAGSLPVANPLLGSLL